MNGRAMCISIGSSGSSSKQQYRLLLLFVPSHICCWWRARWLERERERTSAGSAKLGTCIRTYTSFYPAIHSHWWHLRQLSMWIEQLDRWTDDVMVHAHIYIHTTAYECVRCEKDVMPIWHNIIRFCGWKKNYMVYMYIWYYYEVMEMQNMHKHTAFTIATAGKVLIIGTRMLHTRIRKYVSAV